MAVESTQVGGLSDQYTTYPDPGRNDFPAIRTGYSLVRGSMASETSGEALAFQFNPDRIQSMKRNDWEMRKYTGRSYVTPVWLGGDAKEISFELFMDATPSSNYARIGKPYQLNARDAQASEDSYRDLDGSRGVLPQTELLESFMYPRTSGKPKFSRGGIILDVDRFIPPATIIFSYGFLYIATKLTSLDMEYILFNENLVPLRARAQVGLTVLEHIIVDTSVDPTSENAGGGLYNPNSA